MYWKRATAGWVRGIPPFRKKRERMGHPGAGSGIRSVEKMTTTAEKIAESVVEKPVEKRRALGRGLDSLLPVGPRVVTTSPVAAEPEPAILPELHAAVGLKREPGDAVVHIKLDQIDENPYQTRRAFDEAALQELADSIRVSGVVQPIVVRLSSTGRFTLVLGE